MVRVQDVRLHAARLLRCVVKRKRSLALHVVVSTIAETVVLADQDLAAPTGELHRCELRLVVFLERGAQFAFYGVIAQYVLDCYWALEISLWARIAAYLW